MKLSDYSARIAKATQALDVAKQSLEEVDFEDIDANTLDLHDRVYLLWLADFVLLLHPLLCFALERYILPKIEEDEAHLEQDASSWLQSMLSLDAGQRHVLEHDGGPPLDLNAPEHLLGLVRDGIERFLDQSVSKTPPSLARSELIAAIVDHETDLMSDRIWCVREILKARAKSK